MEIDETDGIGRLGCAGVGKLLAGSAGVSVSRVAKWREEQFCVSAPLPQQLSASRNHLSLRAVMDSYESRSFLRPEAEYSHTSTKAL